MSIIVEYDRFEHVCVGHERRGERLGSQLVDDDTGRQSGERRETHHVCATETPLAIEHTRVSGPLKDDGRVNMPEQVSIGRRRRQLVAVTNDRVRVRLVVCKDVLVVK
jgi:hypothetical protein